MSSPYRNPHIFSPESSERRHKHSNSGDTSVNIATAIHTSKRGKYNDSYYASPSRDSRGRQADILDISKIDHEAIKNDVELKKLSRNPAAFNTNTYEDEDEAYYDEEDSDDDLFAEEERLVNNPSEEHRLRTFISQTSSLSNQNVPRTPKRSLSLFSSNDEVDHNHIHYDKPAITHIPHKNKDSIYTPKRTLDWKDYLGEFLYKVLRACVFQLFMIYWIVKEPVIRTVTFITMIVSYTFVDPIIYIWSIIPKTNQHWVPSLERRRQQIASIFTLIIFISLFTPYIKLYIPVTSTFDLFNATKQFIQPGQSNYDVSTIYFKAANTKILATIKKLESDTNQRIIELQHNLKSDNKNIWSQLEQHQSLLNDHQNQINSIKQTIDKDLRNTIQDLLPNMILVHTNQQGELELSPQFYTYLKDMNFWSDFLKQNDVAIKKYLNGEMNFFFEQQEKQGAVIGKEAFLKLLSKALLQNQNHHHDNNQQSNSADISFDGLIETAIERYHQDVLNTADFALGSRGAHILYTMTSSTFHPHPAWVQALQNLAGLSVPVNTPEMAISPNTHVGECWYMYGSQGQLGIVLSQPIMIQGITIEYPSAKVMMNRMETAPKDMELFGLVNYPNDLKECVSLAQIRYGIHEDSSSIQTFDVTMNPTEAYSAVLIKIKSNWGSADHTDIYRVRIHGIPI